MFDAADVAAESAFWAGVLGGMVRADDEWRLGVQLAPNHVPPDWPGGTPEQQIHVDLWIDDIKAAHEEAMALGAWLLKPDDDLGVPEGFQVHADPASHLFSLRWG